MLIVNNLNGNRVFGLNIGVSNKSTAGSGFATIRKDFGYISKSGKIEKFNLPEIAEESGSIVIYSKDFTYNIKPVFNDLIDLERVKELLNFYIKLKDEKIELPLFSLNLFYKTDDGDILMLPPTVIEYINSRSSYESQTSNVSIFRHPDLIGERSIAYSIGILLYKSLTGEHPVKFSYGEELRDKMRRGIISPPVWKNIKLSVDINNFIVDLLNIKSDHSIDSVKTKVSGFSTENLYREDSNYSREEELYKKREQSLQKSESRRAFLIKHRGILTAGVLVILSSIILFGTAINNRLKPPKTTGFTQIQVLEAYFQCFQSIDSDLIDDVIKRGVRNQDSTELSSLFVTLKMRNQHDFISGIITPDKWLKKPDENKRDTDVYGIYDLKIVKLDEFTFRASYEKWYTQPEGENLDEDIVRGIYKVVRDEVFTLSKTKYSYIITNIETLTERVEKIW